MKNIPINLLILITLLTINANGAEKYILHCPKPLLEKSLEIALAQVGTIEKTGRNDGDVTKYLYSVGLPEGFPYCAAGQYYCLHKAAEYLRMDLKLIPIKRTGLANGMFNDAKLKGRNAKYFAVKHDLIVWRARSGCSGHIERIFTIGYAGWVRTIGFNSSRTINNIRKQGVFIQKRNIYHSIGKLIIRGLIGFSTEGN
ncbi:MAG: hypothetical protein QG635_1575 [Bacteroidota bacterium]|nr:hypothetical protein [Bacteroidota bacterium]